MKRARPYTEILKLAYMLEENSIDFSIYMFLGGYRINIEKPEISIIEHNGSYGRYDNLLEIMGLLTEEEEKRDSICGWLTAENVFNRIMKAIKNERDKNEK